MSRLWGEKVMLDNDVLKVGFIGTHGVGKTTTVEWLEDLLSEVGVDVGVVTDSARECPMPINRKTTEESQIWILLEQVQQEVEETHKGVDVILSDRTVLDAWVYNRVNVGLSSFINSVMREWLHSYDLLFKLERDLEYLEDDGVRDTDLEFWKEIDEWVERGIGTFGLEDKVVKTTSKSMTIKRKVFNHLT